MTKTTAEEALEDLEELGKAQALTFDPYEDGYPTGEESISSHYRYEEYYNGVKNFIGQHLPQTLDEVVKAWEVAGYEMHAQENGAIHIFYKNTIQPSDPIFAFSVSGSETDGMISTKTIHFIKELNAINLTIRYLESKKENENE